MPNITNIISTYFNSLQKINDNRIQTDQKKQVEISQETNKRKFEEISNNTQILEEEPEKIELSLISLNLASRTFGKEIKTTANLWTEFQALMSIKVPHIDLVNQERKIFKLSRLGMEIIVQNKLSIPVADFFLSADQTLFFDKDKMIIKPIEKQLLIKNSKFFELLWKGKYLESHQSFQLLKEIPKDHFELLLNFLKTLV